MTTTVVMVSLIAKIVDVREVVLGAAIVIAANADGAWAPIGDVATTLLWINGQVSTVATIRDLFLPSIFGLIACLLWFSGTFKGEFSKKQIELEAPEPGGNLVLTLGICSLIFVPIIKLLTDLPAFMGMMLGVGAMWVVTDLMHYRYSERNHLCVTSILPKTLIAIQTSPKTCLKKEAM